MIKLNEELRLVDDFENVERIPTRDGYGKGLVELGAERNDVFVLTGDLADSTRTAWFKEKFPERFIDMGVAEQNMINVAVGLALSGKVPFVATYGVFVPGRAWDQIRISVCYNKANVKFAGAHTGISVGPDGATHQALEDVASVRALPNLTILSPTDFWESKKATIAAAKMKGPVYIRFGREKVPVITTEDTPFEIGKAVVYREGKDVTLIATGQMVYQAIIAANNLAERGIDAGIINVHTIKPLDRETIVEAARRTGAVVTAEEHQVYGGLGGAIAELLSKENPVPMRFVAVNDRFGESGIADELLEAFGLTHKEIEAAAEELVKLKK